MRNRQRFLRNRLQGTNTEYLSASEECQLPGKSIVAHWQTWYNIDRYYTRRSAHRKGEAYEEICLQCLRLCL